MPTGPFPFPGLGATSGSEIYRIAPMARRLRFGPARRPRVRPRLSTRRTPGLPERQSRPSLRCQPGDWRYLQRPAKGRGHASHCILLRLRTAVSTPLLATWGTVHARKLGCQRRGIRKRCFRRAYIFPLGTRGGPQLRPTSSFGYVPVTSTIPTQWSPWKNYGANDAIDAPAARFLQWKAVLHSGNTAPTVDKRSGPLSPTRRPGRDDVAVSNWRALSAIPKIRTRIFQQQPKRAAAAAL